MKLTEQDVLCLTNNEKRKAVLAAWRDWPVWADVPEIGLTVHRLDLPGGGAFTASWYAGDDFFPGGGTKNANRPRFHLIGHDGEAGKRKPGRERAPGAATADPHRPGLADQKGGVTGVKIIIRSLENGWETERRMELPEDDGLVKSILRSVKRRSSPSANAEEGVIEDREPKETVLQEPPAVEDKGPAEDVRTVFETGAKGFLLIRCVSCGKEYSFNAKEPLKKSVCRACGTVTQLDELAIAELRCPACGRTLKYRTNSEEPEITCRCIQCGVRMTSRWNGKLKRYLPKE